jgi:putative iron-dependent peroxidase
VLVGEEDVAFAAGSYVIVQKYLHDLDRWDALSTEQQESIIGRKKLSDIELDDSVKPTSAHNALTTITEDGNEIKILRDNMPFGRVGQGEFGTYFIGYSRSPRTTEMMLENMFIGRPPGNYDRLLDFSLAVTGNLFFAPSVDFLDSQGEDELDVAALPVVQAPVELSLASPRKNDGSLRIGSLKGEKSHE